jgi:hypothetical protein
MPPSSSRPVSVNLSEINPGVKMGRPKTPSSPSKSSSSPTKPTSTKSAPKLKRQEMI